LQKWLKPFKRCGRKVVVLNMTTFDPEQAQRAIDFVAGATYAIDAHN